MLSLIESEFLKLKRKFIILIILLTSLMPPLINVLYTLNLPKSSKINNSLMTFFQSEFTFTEWVLFPCILGALGSILYLSEKENRTLRKLMVIPVNKTMFLSAKFIMLVLFSILFMLSTTTCTVIGALLFNYPDMSVAVVIKLFRISLETGIMTSFSIQPIIFIAALSQSGYILPTCAVLIYSISGLTFSSQLAGIHPLSSVYGIVWSESLKNFSMNTSFEIYAVNIAAIFIISFVASVILLKKQSC